MTYYKTCDVGHKNIYEDGAGAPLRCAQCGRNIVRAPEKIYVPEAEEPQEPEKAKEADEAPQTEQTEAAPEEVVTFRMLLQSTDGTCIIPVKEEIIVGRNSAGSSYLENFCDVSKEHFKIIPRASGIAATIKDISRFGTYINGTRMAAGSSSILTSGATIGLASEAVMKFTVEEVE